MARKSKVKEGKDALTQYTFEEEKRLNIPQTGLVSAETDPINGRKTYMFDPHLDPELQWSGKTEGTSFEVDTVSLHVHERIDPLTIIEAVRNKEPEAQRSLFYYFENPENNLPIREAIEFYKHSEGWSNRLIAGDSLIVMNSLLEKEGMAGKVQMIYIDPPYGIKYGSNFQPFINKRDVKDGKDEDLTQEPEMIKAFRDTWELGIHSYLTYLRNRLLLAKDLLTESGSVFVQISDENVHHVKEIMEEIFGKDNFVSIIPFRKKTMPLGSLTIDQMYDFLVWYCKDKKSIKYHTLYQRLNPKGDFHWKSYETLSGEIISLSSENFGDLDRLPENADLIRTVSIKAPGFSEKNTYPVVLGGNEYHPPRGGSWIVSKDGMERLLESKRIVLEGKTLVYKLKYSDFPWTKLTNIWADTVGAFNKVYAVQTNEEIIKRCILMTTDPGDLVFDPTCGSGTTAFVAEQWGRRWITCDTSRVSVALAKQRIMTSVFDFYELSHPSEGVSSGFDYEKASHVTLKSLANDDPPTEEIFYDRPIVDSSKKRVTGPFTVEAVPSQRVVNLEEVEENSSTQDPDNTIARSGETVRQSDWIDELGKTGIRAKGGQNIKFARIEPLQGTKWLQAEGETNDGQKAVISFGPAYAPLEQRQVELAIEEAQQIVPKPKLVIFASFQFDPEASKDIDELKWPGVTVIKCQMNTDLLTEDLKKKKANEESSFWLIGQPDIELRKQGEKYVVTVNGFDYYDTRTGEIKSGSSSNIAMWELDTDYNGRSLYPRQVFFPLEGENGGWS
ncbi:MAG: site-specific DNA-methyltransferase, partial [Candidatus Thermoplasmatota archaeon]|nr:site-specific DNA-methyltransferase [Candidatus Thermoplasmatota archaeon]